MHEDSTRAVLDSFMLRADSRLLKSLQALYSYACPYSAHCPGNSVILATPLKVSHRKVASFPDSTPQLFYRTVLLYTVR